MPPIVMVATAAYNLRSSAAQESFPASRIRIMALPSRWSRYRDWFKKSDAMESERREGKLIEGEKLERSDARRLSAINKDFTLQA